RGEINRNGVAFVSDECVHLVARPVGEFLIARHQPASHDLAQTNWDLCGKRDGTHGKDGKSGGGSAHGGSLATGEGETAQFVEPKLLAQSGKPHNLIRR